MALRKILPIERVPFVGGALCLDFVNTNGMRGASETRERLKTYGDLLVFCGRTGIVGKAQASELKRRAERDREGAQRALAHATEVREALYRVFAAIVDRRAAPTADVALFNREFASASGRRQLAWSRGAPKWSWVEGDAAFDWMLGPILFSAAELLGSNDLGQLRRCGACDWVFLDTSRNRSRRWCKKTCGDRVKSKRYYERHKNVDQSKRRKERRRA